MHRQGGDGDRELVVGISGRGDAAGGEARAPGDDFDSSAHTSHLCFNMVGSSKKYCDSSQEKKSNISGSIRDSNAGPLANLQRVVPKRESYPGNNLLIH